MPTMDNIKITAFQKLTKLAFICLKTDFQNWENDKPFFTSCKRSCFLCNFWKVFSKSTHNDLQEHFWELLFYLPCSDLNMIDCFDIFSSPPYETACSNVVYNLIFDPLWLMTLLSFLSVDNRDSEERKKGWKMDDMMLNHDKSVLPWFVSW